MRVAGVLVVLALVMPPSARAQYGVACSSSADCTDKGYPHCYVYWKDETLGLNTVRCVTAADFSSSPTLMTGPVMMNHVILAAWQEAYDNPTPKPSRAEVKGVCVECMNHCDCGVNQVS